MSTKQLSQSDTARVSVALSGLNHETAEVGLREKFAASKERQIELMNELLAQDCVSEAACYCTCNRTEIVVVKARGASARELRAEVERTFQKMLGEEKEPVSQHLYHLGGRSAVQHLFRVASGLDSMVLGETQILGQLKRAVALAREQGFTNSILNRLFDRAFSTAKRARTETEISAGAVSVSYAAKELAQEIFGPLEGASVLLCGAGETSELMLKHLSRAGVEDIVIANRTVERAADLVAAYGGAAVSLAEAPRQLARADIVIGSCTLGANQSHLFSKQQAAEAAVLRDSRPQFFIDLGVPRNFALDINDIDTAFLYNIDDLSSVADSNRSLRLEAAAQAEEIVGKAADDFSRWLQMYAFQPIIRDLYLSSEEFGSRQVELTLKRIRPHISGDENEVRKALSDLTRSLSKQILARPVSAFKVEAQNDPSIEPVFRELFAEDLRVRRENES